jgi:Holliday junction resolvase-like predicted endonuclease
MADLGDMIIGSLSKVWHLIPIVIFIILFKKFMTNKEKKRRININSEHEKNGLNLESRTIEKYEKLGYKIVHNKTKNPKEEQGIDIICNKDDETFLIKCNNNSKPKSIKSEDIKAFHKNAIDYVQTNNLEKNDVKFRYVIHYEDALDKSARTILKDDYYHCRYVVI